MSKGVIIEMPDSDTEDESDEDALPREATIVSWYPSGMSSSNPCSV